MNLAKGVKMTNYERFAKTIKFELPDRILTYDFVDNRKLLETYGGKGDLIEQNARMAKNIGLDVMRYIYDPINHWMGSKIENWIRFFGINPDKWEVSQKGGTAWISKRPFADLKELEKICPICPRKVK